MYRLENICGGHYNFKTKKDAIKFYTENSYVLKPYIETKKGTRPIAFVENDLGDYIIEVGKFGQSYRELENEIEERQSRRE